MPNWSIASVIINVVLLLALVMLALAWPGGHFVAPWDGPAISTIVLTAATCVLGGVAVLAGFLAVIGYTGLKEHVGNIAITAGQEALRGVAELTDKKIYEAAEAAAERVVKKWLGLPDGAASNEIAEAYGREGDGK